MLFVRERCGKSLRILPAPVATSNEGETPPTCRWMKRLVCPPPLPTDLVALNDALKELSRIDPRAGQTVELRFYGGLSAQEAAEVLDISEETVTRDWRMAKAWLRRDLTRGTQDGA